MFTIMRKMRCNLLFLLLLTVFYKESWASNDAKEDSINDFTTLSPDIKYDSVETTTVQSTDENLDDKTDSFNATPESITTLPPNAATINDESSQTQTEVAQVVTEEAIEQETTLPSSDVLKLEVNENVTKDMAGASSHPSKTGNKEGKSDTGSETSTESNLEQITESVKPVDNGSDLLPDKISKRILISSTSESGGDPINIDEFPEERLDSWRPLPAWSLPDENSPLSNPTVRFPSVDLLYPDIKSSLEPYFKTRENYSVLKEPVTAYYFDLASVIPEQPSGPLFDPHMLKTMVPGNPSNINEPADTLQENLHSSFDDSVSPQPGSYDSIASQNLKHPTTAIQPTPTLSKTVNTAQKSDLVSNIHPEEVSSLITEDVTLSQSRESVTITSIYDRTATDFPKSTPEYTLGNSTDFHFTQGEPNSVKDSTNTSGPDIMPSTLSSDQPLDIQNATGDLRYKNKQSLTAASLFEIPIHPSDLPLPISVGNVIKTRTNPNMKPTLMSRIPLWKRISQRQSLSELSFTKTSIIDTLETTVLPSPTSSTVPYTSIPFENDLPIGILSPGILKYPARTSNDNSIKEDSDTLKDKVSVSSDHPNKFFTQFTASPTTPSLDSSFQSSTSQQSEGKPHPTPISIPHRSVNKDLKTRFNNSQTNLLNISPSFVHTSLNSSYKLDAHDITETEDSIVLTHDSETTTSIDNVSSTYISNASFDNSSIYQGGEFIPMFTKTPFTNQSFSVESGVNTKLTRVNESSHTTLIQPVKDLHLNEEDLSSVVADDPVNSHNSVNPSEKPAHHHPILNEINTSYVEDKTEIKSNENIANTENFEENKVVSPPLLNNSTSLSESFDNFTEKSTDNDQLPWNDSAKTSHTSNGTDSFPDNLDDAKTLAPTTPRSTLKMLDNSTDDIKATGINTSDVEGLVPQANDPSSATPSTFPSTTTATTTSTSFTSPLLTSTSTTQTNISDDLEMKPPEAVENITSSKLPSSAVEKFDKEDTEDKVKVDVIPEVIPGNEPHLHLVKMHQNGTNSTHRSPFIKAEVLYDNEQFCRHQQNIENLLEEWINRHLGNSSYNSSVYEIEIFLPPDCKNFYNTNNVSSSDLENITYVYFYVKRNGEISPQSTRRFPKDPKDLEISQELAYLKNKIRSLELKESVPDPIIDDTNSASLVVIVIVTSIILLLLLGGVLACFMIKRRRSVETIGRRCTPAANDAYSLDSVSVFYHSLRRKSKKRASNKSLKSYLNQGFDDPNLPSRPLSFAKLTLFIADNEAIYEEFSNIPSVVPKYDEMPRGVEDKNRYANVIPVPETRILLGGNKITPSAEYINANSIHGPKGELRYYIATQAPLDNTVADFWQMVWEQESKIIVMLTDFVEKGIDKCADYIPPSETLDCHRVYGEFQITLKSRDMRDNYIMSLLQIKNLENNLVREIAHMWFTGWPQSGVPNEEKLFISFIFDVRTTRKQLRAKGPIIVHCSPGNGRTGTYITCDLCMRQFDDQKVVDIPKTVFRIRRERAGAVQTKEQYSFIYRVVNLYAAKLTTGNLDSF